MQKLIYKEGNLYLHGARQEWIPVQARPCFPWSEPERFITLRDFENSELGLVEDPAALDADSQLALQLGLSASGFVFRIERVDAVDVEFEIRNWKVKTEQGKQVFQTRLDEWPRHMPGGGFLLRDVAGDMFYIPSVNDLDARSRELLSGYID
ncbi:MAG: DUF1854 domain-containing protein [Gammaproteobacteria bacterium]|nr:DUF1854 domain-containing protein [Gammaproteobacteria bacterium]